MKRSIVFMLLLAWFSGVQLHAKSDYRLYYTPSWRQGGMINAFVYPTDGIEKASFALIQLNEKRTARARGQGFPYVVKKAKKREIYLFLVGISALAPADRYQLEVSLTLKDGREVVLRSEELSVESGNYRHQTIQMGAQGQSAISNQSAERQAQAKRFYAALGRFEPQALYDVGRWDLPVTGKSWYYTSRYGAQREFVYPDGSRSRDFHNGEDFGGLAVGSDVLAVADGLVVLAENRVVTGYTVILMHAPGFFSLYYHMNGIDVADGTMVRRGQRVGGIGATGFATGPHLHLMAYNQGQEVDPQWLFQHPLINEPWLTTLLQSLKISKRGS